VRRLTLEGRLTTLGMPPGGAGESKGDAGRSAGPGPVVPAAQAVLPAAQAAVAAVPGGVVVADAEGTFRLLTSGPGAADLSAYTLSVDAIWDPAGTMAGSAAQNTLQRTQSELEDLAGRPWKPSLAPEQQALIIRARVSLDALKREQTAFKASRWTLAPAGPGARPIQAEPDLEHGVWDTPFGGAPTRALGLQASGIALDTVSTNPPSVVVCGLTPQFRSQVLRLEADGGRSVLACTGGAAGLVPCADGPALASGLNLGHGGVAVLPDGDIMVADQFNHRIRRITRDGSIITVAGTGTGGCSDDLGDDGQPRPATQAQLNHPAGSHVTARGELLIADLDNDRICLLTARGTLETLAGPAQGLSRPVAVAEAPDGRVLVLARDGNAVLAFKPGGQAVLLAEKSVPDEGLVPTGGPVWGVQSGLTVTTDGEVLFCHWRSPIIWRIT
jgi:hypothetical protein